MNKIIKEGITVIQAKDPSEGEKLAKEFLYKNSDEQTVLFLSGGKTPKNLYNKLLLEGKLRYGAVGMIDERYGLLGHNNSNANMMKAVPAGRQGFNPFYPILNGESLENTALQYEKTIQGLFARFPKSIGLLGIGGDGHTASLPAGTKNSKFKIQNDGELVTFVRDFPLDPPERITFTFEGLAKLDQIIILVFGEDKKEALRLMFEKGPEWEIPARFFLRPEISQKTILVTDQQV